MNELYPWQHDIWRRLADLDRKHHAILLRGPAGVGKQHLAQLLACSKLCVARGADQQPCGACNACRWFAQGQHPDFFVLEPIAADVDSDSGATAKKSLPQIKIDQVREVLDAITLVTHQGGQRVILINPAEALNANAANALLKSLEEPSAATLFILVNHQRGVLPATIVSRCRAFDVPLPPRPQAQQWLADQCVQQAELALALAGGAPLRALQRISAESQASRDLVIAALQLGEHMDAVAQAERLKNVSVADLIETMQTWLHDLLSLKLARQAQYHLDSAAVQQRLASGAQAEGLLQFQRKLIEAKRLVNHPLNARLVAEDLLLSYRMACARQD